jgi:NAD+ kinase
MAGMHTPGLTVRRAALLVHPELDGVEQLAADILTYLHNHDIEADQGWVDPDAVDDEIGVSDLDLIIALGGDGTMLRAGSHGSRTGTPVLGINLGRVGFLTEVKRENWRLALDQVLAGDCWLEARMRLSIALERAGQQIGRWEALNEGVVSRGRTARPIRLRAQVDGRFLATYVADALICATPTGSTAYALAAGGPILPPRMRNLLLMPVAPHLSVDRGIVLPEGSSVDVHLLSGHDTDLTCDGQVALALQAGDRITVETSDRDALFCRLKDQGYFFRNLMSYLGTESEPEDEA